MKVEFYSVIDGIDLMYPPLPASEVEMDWVKGARDFYVNKQKEKVGSATGAHLCSGIRGLLENAYILTTWHDTNITTNGDGSAFEWETTETNSKLLGENQGVEYFPGMQFGDYTNLPPQTLKTVLKFPTPWRVKLPKGWGLMYLPLHYHGESRFTSLVGILDTNITNSLHAVLFWHELNGTTFIKAGTPLCYLVPVKLNEDIEFVVREATEKELRYDKTRAIIAFTVWKNKGGILAKFKEKFWGKE
jgi:hypothetical protein